MPDNGRFFGDAHRDPVPKVFALNPAGYANPDLAIAASRAGATAVLNAEFAASAAWIEPALARLARFGGPSIGFKLGSPNDALIRIAAGFGDRLSYLVVDPLVLRRCGNAVAAFRECGCEVALEVTDWSAEIAALCGHVDLLWLKGHEAGGWVGEQTSFILLQRIVSQTALPIFVRGGVNCTSSAAMRVGGAAGVVLDDQLLLLRESPLAAALTPKLRHFTSMDTALVEQEDVGLALRIWLEPGRRDARLLTTGKRRIAAERIDQIGWRDSAAESRIVPLGQDAAVASAWAESYGSVSAALVALAAAINTFPGRAAALGLCGPATQLAQSHGTRYPIVQGPMTHVSDRIDFIEAVAAAGALPMVAVSLSRGDALHRLLRDAKERLGNRPWGVGMLGFVPAEILKEQRAAVRDSHPSFAIIAGGRPDQARELEEAGIITYLHVPSPALLAQFLEQGSRHFIFEGRECGGHIGPLSSFVLWGQMTDALITSDLPAAELRKVHVLFAGGIHDARSSAMAAVMAVPLADHGIRSGILMGTGYAFTREAVTSGSITPEFQRIIAEATQTVGLTTGPGHASRCAVTPFVETFWQRRRELETAGSSTEDIRAELEDLSVGRLRLATKGVFRKRADHPDLRPASVEEQRASGMFMIGQAAVLRDQPTTIAELHRAVCEDAMAYLRAMAAKVAPKAVGPTPLPADLAIVGMSAILPGAENLPSYWQNILDKTNVFREVPAERWPWQKYFNADRDETDAIYSKWGGFMGDVPFDPTHFGILPVSMPAIDPLQLLALVAVERALNDAGMSRLSPEQREVTSVILGFTGGLGELGIQYGTRAEMRRACNDVAPETLAFLPQWTSDSFAGLLPNVIAGRVANRFDFGGVNFVVDAACASSLAALRQAALELESGRSDIVLCGGIETGQGPFGFTCFSKVGALSPTGECHTFDSAANGTVLAEGVAMLVLKRLADAERDNNRIYAVIKGIGGSSDGRARGLMAPLPKGQKLALSRAYAQAGYSPATVELFEAHGTGTVAGDAAELESLSEFLSEHGALPQQSAVGSVKTMIGHAKAAAGIAGLIKVALGLYHHVLPPHMGVKQPNAMLQGHENPLALHQQARPWLATSAHPRRAGVNSFGFGGTNFHAALEEYQGDYRSDARPSALPVWPAELFAWRAENRAAVIAAAAPTLAALEAGATPPLAALAETLSGEVEVAQGKATLAIVAGSHIELRACLTDALMYLHDPDTAKPMPASAYFSDRPLTEAGRLALLFSGQGSQYPDMLRELSITFEELREAMEVSDAIMAETPTYRDRSDPRLSRLIYRPDRFGEAEEAAARTALSSTDVAQPALGTVALGLLNLIDHFGVRAEMVAGHSYGEYVALHAAGVLTRDDLLRVSEARGRFIIGATRDGDLGTMAAVATDAETLRSALDGCDVTLANLNAPTQTVISGSRPAIKAAIERLGSNGLAATLLPVAAAFHSPLMQPAQEPLVRFLAGIKWAPPRIPVYANTTAALHDVQPERIREVLGRHLTEPVRFVEMLESMYADGARVFLEIGPKSVLADLTRRTLGARPHRAVSLDGTGGGITAMLHALSVLLVEGVELQLGRLFEGRTAGKAELPKLLQAEETKAIGPNTWLLNGRRARRASESIQVSAEPPSRHPAENMPRPPQGTRAVMLSHPNGIIKREEYPMDGYDGPAPMAGGPGSNPPADDASLSGTDRALAEYHQTMRQFLQVQERVMTSYLSGGNQTPRPFVSPRPAVALPQFTIAAPAAAPVTAPEPVAASRPTPAPAKTVSAPSPVVPPLHPSIDPKALLLQIASDRTGYPQDMLGLDLNLEADLGIDSIKRVEILGAFRKALPAAASDQLSTRMDELSKARTLQAILDVVAASSNQAQGTTPSPFDLAGKGQEKVSAPLSRYVVRPWAEPLPCDQPKGVITGLYVVVPDDIGVAAALSKRLELRGARVRLLPDTALSSEDALGKWLGTIRAEDRIRGIIDLRSIARTRGGREMDFAAWRDGMNRSIKVLHGMLRLSASDLTADGQVLVASSMGGYFARDALQNHSWHNIFAGDGGAVGLIKCLSFEWPNCTCKAIDLDVEEPVEHLADHLCDEIATPEGRREVGYPAGTRTIFRTEPASLIPQALVRVQPDRSWVVLAIGGARGITAEALREFAAAGAVCVIVGRSPLPEPEDPQTLPLRDVPALRAHFLAHSRKAGERPTPAVIESRITALLRDREARANLDDFKAAGARLDYRVCDVRQESEVVGLLNSLYEKYGAINAVLFGAGVIEDRLLVNKTSDSISRVLDTKVDAAFLIARGLKPEHLKFIAFFTSVAGRYGNPGQTDYGAANEVLNRFAWLLQARWGPAVKVSAINWGPWARTTHGPGMLTPETARQFRERGVNLIEPEEGREYLIRELLYAPPDQVEVIAGEHPWEYQEAAAARRKTVPADSMAQPLLLGTKPIGNAMKRKIRKTIDLVSDPYLDDHRLDGWPVLPFACATEYMAEAASVLAPGRLRSLSGVRMLHGLSLRDDPLDIEIGVQSRENAASASVELQALQPKARVAYCATAEFGDIGASVSGRLRARSMASSPLDIAVVYRSWLFHGPVFQTLHELVHMDRELVIAKARATSPTRFYPPAKNQHWTFDPGIVDGALQLIFAWSRHYRDAACLPTAIGRITRYDDVPLQGELTLSVQVRSSSADSLIEWQLEAVDADDRTRLTVEDGEVWLDPKLNRICGGWAGGVPAVVEA